MLEKPSEFHDVVVVLPGVLGSTLAKDGRLVWAPSAGAAIQAIRTLGESVRGLALEAGVGDDHPGDAVQPVSLMPDLHLLPGIWSWNIGYDMLLRWLRSRLGLVEAHPGEPGRPVNLVAVPYDWRLSNRYNGRRLARVVEPALERWRSQGGVFADAKLVFVCHSMGGLVARWYVEMEGGAEVTRRLVTLGTPYRGALNALDQLVNGVRKGLGWLRLDLSAFTRSLPSIYQLLPEYACLETADGLAKTTETALPAELDAGMVADGMRFHQQLDDAADKRGPGGYDLHPIVGFRQPTRTTARLREGRLEAVDTIEAVDEGGDATVPRLSAVPKELRLDSPAVRWVADQHGALQRNPAVLDELEGALTARPVVHRAPVGVQLGVRVDEVVLAGEPVGVEATVSGDERVALQAVVLDEQARPVTVARLRRSSDGYNGRLGPFPPAAYQVAVGGVGATAVRIGAVTSAVLVWEPETPG